MQADDDPVVVWGQPAAHFCLGQHQSLAAELVSDLPVPVIRRPLGGGGVWLDRQQICWVLIAPRGRLPSRPADWYEYALAPMLAVYAGMGWDACLVEQDVWLHGKKLAGSGAATIGNAGLIGASFLLHFPVDEFVQLIAAPSAGYRDWLRTALATAMTSWSDYAEPPSVAWLSLMFRRAGATWFDWRWEQAMLTLDERVARDEYRPELLAEAGRAKRLVAHGIKIHARSFLTEQDFGGDSVRVLTHHREITRLAISTAPHLPEAVLMGIANTEQAISAQLAAYLSSDVAQLWAQRILLTAYFPE
ncbi:MAG: lipoate--protein ligase family protein [Sulfuriferula sp.]|nr:lipoate--protein ligase family protein [Sulfuriferula sp.]